MNELGRLDILVHNAAHQNHWKKLGPAQPEEIAPAYVFLASAVDSSDISGEILNVLGGTTTAG